MDYEISINEYGVKDYMLKFKDVNTFEKAYEVIREYFNIHYNSISMFDIYVEEEECEVYIVCNEFHLNGIKKVLDKELNINGDWV